MLLVPALLTLLVPTEPSQSPCGVGQDGNDRSCHEAREDFFAGREQGKDSGTILAAISRLEQALGEVECLRCVPERGIPQEEIDATDCRTFCEDRKGTLVLHRELGDLYRTAAQNRLDDVRQLNDLAARMYEQYISEFLQSPCVLAPLTEREWPRYVLVALGNALVDAGRGQEIIEKYETLAERVLDYPGTKRSGVVLFDVSALKLWRQALEESTPAHRDAFCEILDSKDLLVGRGTREEIREECVSRW